MPKSHFIVGISEEKPTWLRVVGMPHIETIPISKGGGYFCDIAKLDMEILTISFCAMSLDLRIHPDSATIYPVNAPRVAALIVAPVQEIQGMKLRSITEEDTDDTIRETANYRRAKHKWEHIFQAIAGWLNYHDREYRIGFDCDLVDWSTHNDLDDKAIVLGFMDVFPSYHNLFY